MRYGAEEEQRRASGQSPVFREEEAGEYANVWRDMAMIWEKKRENAKAMAMRYCATDDGGRGLTARIAADKRERT
jgi:hypothetical protein